MCEYTCVYVMNKCDAYTCVCVCESRSATASKSCVRIYYGRSGKSQSQLRGPYGTSYANLWANFKNKMQFLEQKWRESEKRTAFRKVTNWNMLECNQKVIFVNGELCGLFSLVFVTWP